MCLPWLWYRQHDNTCLEYSTSKQIYWQQLIIKHDSVICHKVYQYTIWFNKNLGETISYTRLSVTEEAATTFIFAFGHKENNTK